MTSYLRQFKHTKEGIVMSQQSYVAGILEDLEMIDCNPSVTPMEEGLQLLTDMGAPAEDGKLYRGIVGKLLYLTNTRPDISYAVGILARFMHSPQTPHLLAVKRLARYLNGTANLGLLFPYSNKLELQGFVNSALQAGCEWHLEEDLEIFTDSDWAGDKETRRSTRGYVFRLGDSLLSWCSKRQPTVSLSSTEAEYRAMTEGAKELVWLRGVLQELGISLNLPTPLWCDNLSSIKISRNPVFHPDPSSFHKGEN
ncbi:hypothetical protein R1flu_017566 [Riccia fluitans]|uniref:Reverse transcriptase Ty1/copia-type domain-containing protein n=1 Tax=Riccia fluitans TaxID=41844 RepID=A0ABD1ZDE7_9MARC